MECSRCTERFADLLDGSLGAGEARQVEAHLEACQACGRLWKRYQGLVRELHADAPCAVRVGFADQVVARVSADRWSPSHPSVWARFVAHGRLAAAAVVILVGFAAGLHFAHRRPLGLSDGPVTVVARPATPSAPLGDLVTDSVEPDVPSDAPAPPPPAPSPSAATGHTPSSVPPPGPDLRPTPAAPPSLGASAAPAEARARALVPPAAPSRSIAGSTPETRASVGASDPERRDADESAADRRRAAMNLIGGAEGMSTSFSAESIESVRARQMVRENPYSNAAPEPWTDPSRTHHNFVFRGTRLSTALESVAKTGNIRIVTRGPINGNVTVNIQNARPEAALERIASLANLRVSQRGDTYIVEQVPDHGPPGATRSADGRPPD